MSKKNKYKTRVKNKGKTQAIKKPNKKKDKRQ
jgi:hypothetical protein